MRKTDELGTPTGRRKEPPIEVTLAKAVRRARFNRTGRGKAYDPDLPLHETEIEDAAAFLAALRETHHLVPKDQEPVGEAYRSSNGTAMVRMTPDYTAEMQAEDYQPTPLYAPEKPNGL
jgi:hypothetical protein